MRFIIILSIFIFIRTVSLAQNPKWVNCLSGEDVYDMATTDEALWIATSGGVVVSNLLGTKQVNLEDMPTGVYFLQIIETSPYTTSIYKIIKP